MAVNKAINLLPAYFSMTFFPKKYDTTVGRKVTFDKTLRENFILLILLPQLNKLRYNQHLVTK